MTRESATIWVCIDCMLMHANGETSESPDREPWSAVGDDVETTMGLLSEEHNEECDVRKTGSWPANYECDCERREFSWSSCDGCGSSLGGERHAFTIWWES